MTRTLVTGATGRLGRVLVPRLIDEGHAVRAASRTPPGRDATGGDDTEAGSERLERDSDHTDGSGRATGDAAVEWVELDLAEGTGIEAAVADVDVVVHAASAPMGDTEAVDVDGTERLLAAAAEAAVTNFLYVSIVGIDEIPYSYYEHKLTAERAVESSDVPGSILRATQFHSFVDDLLGSVARLPVWPLPTKFRIQPIAASEVAAAVAEYATPEAHGRVEPVGGPAVHSLGELATAYRDARGLRRPIVRLPIPGAVAGAFRAGHATCPDRAVGTVTWESWLAERYGSDGAPTSDPTGSPS